MHESIAMAGLLTSFCPARKRPPSAGELRLAESGVLGAFGGEIASKQDQSTHLRLAERDARGCANAASEPGIPIGHSRPGKGQVGFEGSLLRRVAERSQPLFEIRFDRAQRLDVSGQTGPEHSRPNRAAETTDSLDLKLQGTMETGDLFNDRFHFLRARIF